MRCENNKGCSTLLTRDERHSIRQEAGTSDCVQTGPIGALLTDIVMPGAGRNWRIRIRSLTPTCR